MKKLLLACLIVFACARPQAALELWPHYWMVPFDRAQTRPDSAASEITIRVTPGEYEPAAFAVRSPADVQVTVSLADLPADWFTLEHASGRTDSTALNRLLPVEGPVAVKAAETAFFWLTVRPPADTPAGSYKGKVVVETGSGRSELPVACEVLPFTLAESAILDGAFMFLIDLPPGWYQDMKEHGFDAIQFFTWEYAIVQREQDRSAWPWDPVPVKIKREGDRLALDFTTMDAIMDRIVEAEMKGPVVFSLGNDHHLFYECCLAEAFGLKVDSLPSNQGRIIWGPKVSKELDRLFVEGLEQLRDHWKEKAYPQELVLLIYDEPTERLLDRCKNRYDLIKSFWPEVRIYGVVMNRRDWAESMLDQMDIIVTNGGFEENGDLARSSGKDFWVYGGVRDQHDGRYQMGLLPWKNRASGSFFWMYNYWQYDPDGCAVYMHPGDPNRIVHSPAWEAMREGHDDLRYIATAEMLIAKAGPDKQEPARRRLEALRRSLGWGRARGGRRMEGASYETRTELYALTDKVRSEVIEIIAGLL